MVPRDPGEEVRVERGAVLVIAGCVFLYLAFLAEAAYRGTSEPAHLVAGAFILYGVLCLVGGFLGLLGRPASTPLAGASYAAGGWLLASAAARGLAGGFGWVEVLLVAVGAPLAVVAEVYGVALFRGVEQPAEGDPLTRRVLEALPGIPARLRR